MNEIVLYNILNSFLKILRYKIEFFKYKNSKIKKKSSDKSAKL